MDSTVATASALSHRLKLDQVRATAAKDLKKVNEWRARVGAAVGRAFKLANLSQKEVAGRLTPPDESPASREAQVSRWVAGTERPQFDALLTIPELRQPLVVVVAELAGEGVAIVTQIQLSRSATR